MCVRKTTRWQNGPVDKNKVDRRWTKSWVTYVIGSDDVQSMITSGKWTKKRDLWPAFWADECPGWMRIFLFHTHAIAIFFFEDEEEPGQRTDCHCDLTHASASGCPGIDCFNKQRHLFTDRQMKNWRQFRFIWNVLLQVNNRSDLTKEQWQQQPKTQEDRRSNQGVCVCLNVPPHAHTIGNWVIQVKHLCVCVCVNGILADVRKWWWTWNENGCWPMCENDCNRAFDWVAQANRIKSNRLVEKEWKRRWWWVLVMTDGIECWNEMNMDRQTHARATFKRMKPFKLIWLCVWWRQATGGAKQSSGGIRKLVSMSSFGVTQSKKGRPTRAVWDEWKQIWTHTLWHKSPTWSDCVNKRVVNLWPTWFEWKRRHVGVWAESPWTTRTFCCSTCNTPRIRNEIKCPNFRRLCVSGYTNSTEGDGWISRLSGAGGGASGGATGTDRQADRESNEKMTEKESWNQPPTYTFGHGHAHTDEETKLSIVCVCVC